MGASCPFERVHGAWYREEKPARAFTTTSMTLRGLVA